MPTAYHALTDLYRKSFSGLPRKVWLLALVLLVNRSGAMVVAFLSIYLIDQQGMPATRAGYVMAAFGAGGILGNYVGGLLNDRFGSWHIQFYSLIGAGVLHIVLGFAESFWVLCLLAFVISLWADAFRPANRAAVAIYAPPEKLTQAYGLVRMAVNLGFAIGPALGGYLIYTYGFQLMFWGDGLTFLAAAAVFYLALPPDETARPLVSKAERVAQSRLAVHPDLAPAPAHKQPWLLAFVLANVGIMICFFQLFSTFPVYLKESGFDERTVGWLFTLSGVLIVIAEMPLLYLTDRRYRPLPVMVVGAALIIGAFGLVIPAIPLGFWALVGMIMVLTVGEMLYMPFTNTFVSTHAPAARRGEYLGLLSASYSAAFVLTPLIGFAVAERSGYAAATLACCGVAVAGWLVLSIVNKLRKAREARRRARVAAL